jgi:phthiocerol/phenolphthiocerol synthesis type-I polyketide synthase B
MGRQLLAHEPAFAASIADLEPTFVDEVGFSLRDALIGEEPLVGSARIQPVLVGIQLALTTLWRAYGVQPDALIGHSIGEVTAAIVAESLTATEGLGVIATRSRLMSRLAGHGAMALLELDTDGTEDLIADYPQVSVAVYASPRQTVIAGPCPDIDAVISAAQRLNRFARRVNIEVPAHHPIMDPILPELQTALIGLTPRSPKVPVITTVENADPATLFGANHWVANLRDPVRFSQAIATAGAAHTTFIEISPHPLLTKAISDTLGAAHHHSIGTLQRDTHDAHTFHTNLSRSHTTHPPVTDHPADPPTAIPTTPWHHTRYWFDSASALPATSRPRARAHSPNGFEPDAAPASWLYELEWPVRPLSLVDTTSEGPWLILAERDLGTELSRVCDAQVTVLAPSVVEESIDNPALVDALAAAEYVLYAPTVTGTQLDVTSAYRLFNGAKRLAAKLAAARAPSRLFIMTRNGQPVSEGDRANPAHAALWGLGRTLALEHPEIWGGIVDLDDSVPCPLAARYLLAEARADDHEDQVVYRGGVRHVPRLVKRNPPIAEENLFGDDTCHLVVGATGHIGPHLIGQLAGMGARTIVAVSRNPGSRLDELARRLSSTGTQLISVAADAADEVAMTALFDRFGTDLPALEGIYLAAYGGGPVTLDDMSHEDVNAMFRAKLDVAALLHTLSLKMPVRQFVLFSSISGLLGSRWLGHYAATTTFLDTLAYARRALGLAATAVNWGAWKSLADEQSDARQVFSESGIRPMADAMAIRALPWATSAEAPVRLTVVDADWPRLAAAYRSRGSLRIVDDLLGQDEAAPSTRDTEFRKELRKCTTERRRDVLVDRISALASAVMGLSAAETLDASAGFFQLGMDSLMSVTLQRDLSETLGEELSPAVVFDYPTVERLADHLTTVLPELAEANREDADGYEYLTEDELLQELSQRLADQR